MYEDKKGIVATSKTDKVIILLHEENDKLRAENKRYKEALQTLANLGFVVADEALKEQSE
jgi:hypothetical protein